MNLETCLQMLIKVNRYADSEFHTYKILTINIYHCCLHKVNKLVEIKNDPRGLLPNVNKGKQVC